MLHRSLVLFATLVVASCDSSPYIIDQFPIVVGLGAGVPVVGATAPEVDNAFRALVVDTGSPQTVLAPLSAADPARLAVTLTVLRWSEPGDSTRVARARFLAAPALIAPAGRVGLGEASADIDGVLGGDLLRQLALRIEPWRREIRLFPDIAGEDSEFEEACKAILPAAVRGGGRYEVEGGVARFPATRLVLGACLGASPASPDQPIPFAGRNAQLLVATGVPITVVSEATYLGSGGALADLPESQIHLPGGPAGGVPVRLGELPLLGLVGNENDEWSPCRELQASRIMARGGCGQEQGSACPCPDGDALCDAGASLELDGPMPVAVVQDAHPLLQALRNELRPQVAEIDGLLGMDVLARLVTDIDYPHGRMLVECAPGVTACVARPRLANGRLPALRHCFR